jgi:hypothetical protein
MMLRYGYQLNDNDMELIVPLQCKSSYMSEDPSKGCVGTSDCRKYESTTYSCESNLFP